MGNQPNGYVQREDMKDVHKILHYNQITEYIYIGNNMCCRTHFEEELLSKGITADISLELENTDEPKGVKYFFYLPWADMTAPTQELLELGVSFLNSLENMKIKTYVHCKNGHGRAPTLVAAYLISKGTSVEEAISFIKSKRPVIHPTEAQIMALKEFKANRR